MRLPEACCAGCVCGCCAFFCSCWLFLSCCCALFSSCLLFLSCCWALFSSCLVFLSCCCAFFSSCLVFLSCCSCCSCCAYAGAATPRAKDRTAVLITPTSFMGVASIYRIDRYVRLLYCKLPVVELTGLPMASPDTRTT